MGDTIKEIKAMSCRKTTHMVWPQWECWASGCKEVKKDSANAQ